MRQAVAVVLLAAVCGAAFPGVADGAVPVAVAYVAPVPGPVVDPWGAPRGPFAPGNRGIDLAARPGDPVRAAAGGVVVFAGEVAGSRHVVVLHPDGLRTTYAFLAEVAVARGDEVEQGRVVGLAAGPVHFGVRAGDRYLDPAEVLGGRPRVHLVPVTGGGVDTLDGERSGLLRFLGTPLRAGSAAVSWVAGGVAIGAESGLDLVAWAARDGWAEVERWLVSVGGTAALAIRYLRQPVELLVAVQRMQAYRADQRGCTPAGRPPDRPAGRRIAVLVAGFGSDGRGDAIADLDTRALGYADDDVAQFSYAGGQVGGRREVAGVEVRPYGPDDASGDLAVSARRLRDLLVDLRVTHPGVPIDVVAHSQGGLVARAALADDGVPDPRLAPVANLVTLGSPHTGADLATAAAWTATSAAGALALAGAGMLAPVDPFAPAAAQLVEGSPFLRDLAATPLRPTVRFTSIASAGDLVVTANHSAVDEAVNVLVSDRPGTGVHGGLPGSDAVRREIALALAGRGPTCRSLWGDMATAVGVSTAEDLVGAAAGGLGHAASRTPARPTPTRTPGPASSLGPVRR